MAEFYMGQLLPFAGNFVIRGTAAANGNLLSISQNTALFSLLGTTYGGNGQTTFGLPNLQGRAPIGYGQSPGTSFYDLGQTSGVENTTLTLSNLPAHNHPVNTSGLAVNTSGLTVNTNGLTATPNLTANISTLTATLKAVASAPNTTDPDGDALAQANIFTDSGAAPATALDARSVQLGGSIGIGGTVSVGGTASIGGTATVSGNVTTGPTGSNLPFSVLNPYLAINWLVVIEGLFPSRN
jgi:microcystin-dependent protein